MDGSDHKSVSSSTTIKSFSNPKLSSSGTDENDKSYHETSINLLNSNKPMTKHFMSPTTSSASKAIAPRKKILAERNGNDDAHFKKSSNVSSCDDSLSLSNDLKLYETLTNYPSPRPKFLRYKPNGRREIILRYENEVKERKERADLVSVSQEGEAVEERDEEVEEQEEEEEEEEEERGAFLRRVLEFVLALLVLVLSTLYISSMNSSTSSPTSQAIKGFKDGWYLKIHDRVYETMSGFRSEDHYLKVREFMEIVKIFGCGSKFVDGNLGLMKLNQTVLMEGFEEEEMFEDVYARKVEEMSNNLSQETERQGGDSEKEVIELQVGESEYVYVHEMEKTGEGFDQTLENFELKRTEDVEKLESFEDNQKPTMSYAFQQDSEVVMEPVQEVNNLVDGSLEAVKSEITTETAIANSETLKSEAEANLKERLVEQIEDTIFKAVIGVNLFFAVTLVLAFHLKRKKNIGKESSPIPGVMEKCSSVIPERKHVNCVDSFPSSTSLVSSHSNQGQGAEDSIDLYQSRRPSIELLGEFEVVQMSSSLRSCGGKSRIAESEVSSHAVSFDKEFGNWNKAHSVPIHAQPCVSEFSAMNSHSCGHFTPEKKLSRKEDGRDGEDKKVVLTPVRRSSRIRNRAIASP